MTNTTNNSMQVTHGYGVAVATLDKGNKKHQRVAVLADRHAPRVVLGLLAGRRTYAANRVVGGPVAVEDATRTPGDTALLESVAVFSDSSSAPTLDVYLFREPPAGVVDNGELVLTRAEALGLLARVSFAPSDFAKVGDFWHASRAPQAPAYLSSGSTTSVHAVAVVRSALVFASADSLVVVPSLARD